MKKLAYILAALAAVSTSAVAKDLKQSKATQMTNSEMEKVTAGANGNAWGFNLGRGVGQAWQVNDGLGPNPNGNANGHVLH